MGAVTIWRVAGILAATEQRRLGALGGEHQRLDAGAVVGAVAKRLFLASPAAAPSIAFTLFELDLVRAELWSLWL
jgi:hypothetical protein